MEENMEIPQYIIQLQEPMEANSLVTDLANLGIQVDSSHFSSLDQPMYINGDEQLQMIQEMADNNEVTDHQETSCIFQVVYPHELCLNPVNTIKRGRPKKKRNEEDQIIVTKQEEETVKVKKVSRTRSGRVVKPPKHIEKDFKKIEITADEEIRLTDFEQIKDEPEYKPQVEFQELTANQKKRNISNQYKCPKCSKAYLGRRKIIQHLTKNPDHGPFPEGNQKTNFDLWNYLFDITQKCKSGQKGIKFCQELNNLLNNIIMLKNTLFKTVTDINNNKNCVDVDKVLGNAIGLNPGKYKFDENELFKDVNILELITNTDYFKPNGNKANNVEENFKKFKPNIEESHPIENANMKNVSSTTQETIETVSCRLETLLDLEVKPQDDKPTINTEKQEQDGIFCDVESANILDNSTNSDDSMNVDQFVNERFVGTDLEINGLELPLDLFHFSDS